MMMLEDLYRLLRMGHVQAQGIVDTMTQPVVVLDHGMCVTTANPAFIKSFGAERDDIIGQNFFQLGDGQWDIPELKLLISEVIPKAAAVVGFQVTHDFPTIGKRTFLVDARRLVHPDDNSTSILVIFDDVTLTQRHEAEQDFIISEMRHRMKNLFAVVRALANETQAEGQTVTEYRETFLARLDLTLRAQEIAASAEAIDFETLVRRSVGSLAANRLKCDGPSVAITASKVVSTSMIFHELATNAAKYGGLATDGGRLQLTWSVENGPRDRTYLKCEWREVDGLPVKTPSRKGYGSELIEGMITHLGGSMELNFLPEGLAATINLPM
ncbi:PAS domain-containing protein [Rhizobium grahamii]